MCCRYYTEMSPKLRSIIEEAQRSRLYLNNVERIAKPLITEGEVFPNSLVPVLASNRTGQKSVFPMIWGYNVTGVNRLVANARIETADYLPTFKDSWVAHRCIIPASWYFEWQHVLSPSGKQKAGDKFSIMPRGSDVTYLCGLYRLEENFPHFVILTREPSDSVSHIHDRMPFILPESEIETWINPRMNPYLELPHALTDMIAEKVPTGAHT